MSPSLYTFGLLALLQLVSCKSVSEKNGVLSKEIQSMWENLLLQAQASDSELQDQEEILEQDVMSDQMQEDIEEMFEQDALMPSETQEQEFGLSDVQAILEEQGLYKEPGVSEQSSKKKKNKNAIYSGDTIALQTINRIEWMSFGGDSEPHTATCPKQYMEEVDYKSCTGEVFQIYRRKGEGIVRSGDFVGIYKPGENVWLGCPKSRIYTLPCFDKNFKPCRRDPKCFKATCPGEPNLKTGFSDKEDWNNCLGEVFKIYSRGKKDGNIITHRDDVILLQYATTRNVYVYEGSINNRYVYSCFDPPQDSSSFERCHNGVFNIWKQGLAE